jgi:hypothetical protein
LSFDVFNKGTPALDGKAIRRQVTVYFSKNKSGPKMDLLIYQRYADHVEQFPVDAHMLIALIAPSAVVIANRRSGFLV